ncbi:glutamate ABC transporter substrate-binding protein [Microbispora corallina]|uniref:Glutamate-binding protein n=1 Tax=Microbispora corallina TaxID=83302 RepID=A0ABQ4FSJ9_9ACTN|nr:transporter substrate-binding domain-containing protein [Microbispora corallina]GIH37683.1 glutamate-binding protein [Microbispora corallina]
MWRAVALVSCLATAVLAGCGADGGVVIGVRPGQPGLVTRLPDGDFTGFDIAVAQYVARDLGYRDDEISYTLDPSQADLVVGADPAHGRYVAGPYLVTSTEILVRAGDLTIGRVRDLTRKRVCATQESSARLVSRFGQRWKGTFLALANVPAACAPLLADGRTDAIVADAPVLAGIEAQYPGRFRFAGKPITTVRYGIGAGSAGLRDRVDEALRHMFDDGTWKQAVIDNLGVLATRYTVPPPLTRPAPGR